MADPHKNFAYSTIVTIPSPASSGTSLTVGLGQGALFPAVPFNATIWPTGTQPISTNAEIVTVTAIATDTFTIVRAQEGSSARTVVAGDQIAATITKDTLTKAENVNSSLSPFILISGVTGVQTLASATGQSSTGSLLVFPITVPQNLQFNQVIVPNQLSVVTNTSNTSFQNSYYSKFGLYSMNANTLSLISSSSFSIGETINSQSMTWNYPTSTATSGYAYGSFPAGNLTGTAQWTSYIVGTRAIGLQFGGNLSLTPGMYWMGLMSQRSTSQSSTAGLSQVGIVGQVINPINSVGTVSGGLPIGLAASQWTLSNSHITGWWGRHVVGFVTATSIGNFGGSAIPSAITLSELADFNANSTVSILPSVTLVST